MKEISNTIKTKITTYTTTKISITCPQVGSAFVKESDIDYERCKGGCNFFVNGNCEYRLYEVKLLRQSAESDDDDECGGMPVTDYTKVFKCADCDGEVVFTSGMSGLGMYDNAPCKKCGLEHYYMGWRGDLYQFAVSKKKRSIERQECPQCHKKTIDMTEAEPTCDACGWAQ